MKKAMLAFLAVLFLVVSFLPTYSFSEDKNTVLLARTIYTLAKDEGYDSMLAVGSVVMNRVDSPWYSDDLEEVLTEAHQFPCGTRYDRDSLNAAHAVLTGKRTLSPDCMYYQSADAENAWDEGFVAEVGSYRYFTVNGNR